MSRAPAIRFHAAKSKAAASRNTALPGLEDKSLRRPQREMRPHVCGAVHAEKLLGCLSAALRVRFGPRARRARGLLTALFRQTHTEG